MLHFELVTPEKLIRSEDVHMVVVPGTEGDFGVLEGHAPFMSTVRDGANHRRYERSVLRRIAFIRSAARVGLTLDEIATALATLPSGRTPTRADWARLSALWRHRIEDQIARLEHLRDDLDTCIGCGCLSLDRCALANPADRRAEEGPGAPGLEP